MNPYDLMERAGAWLVVAILVGLAVITAVGAVCAVVLMVDATWESLT